MHQKKSEVQIGKESTGVSSDFNPQPSLHFQHPDDHRRSNPLASQFQFLPLIIPNDDDVDAANAEAQLPPKSTSSTPLHKRPLTTSTHTHTRTPSFNKSSTLSPSLHQYPNHHPHFHQKHTQKKLSLSSILKDKASAFSIFIRRFQQLRRLRVHLRLVLLISLPFFYFLVSHPSHSFILDFLSAFAFSTALLFSLNLALPRLPSIRLFLARSFPIKLNPLSSSARSLSRSQLPVFWSIGSRSNLDKRTALLESGCCVRVYSNGDVYEGEFLKGNCSGSGVYYYYMSGRYEGDWVDGKYDGYGVETWARGSRYRGQYRQGLRHGFGVYRFYTGDVYAGEWSNGQSHGCGVHTCEDGSRYVGEFKWGVKHGHGHYHFRNGDTYAGEYFADRMHGFGVYRFANGHRYEGAWHEGRRQGLGMYSFRNGETQAGHWQNGILDVPSTQSSSYPISPVAVYHSKVLNSVQEARRAAEKAYDVAKVDERVNRAVTAANKAANAAQVAAVKAAQQQMNPHINNLDFHIPIA